MYDEPYCPKVCPLSTTSSHSHSEMGQRDIGKIITFTDGCDYIFTTATHHIPRFHPDCSLILYIEQETYYLSTGHHLQITISFQDSRSIAELLYLSQVLASREVPHYRPVRS